METSSHLRPLSEFFQRMLPATTGGCGQGLVKQIEALDRRVDEVQASIAAMVRREE